MSGKYYKQLEDQEVRQRYSDKLTFNGIILPDPLDEDLRKLLFKANNYKSWPDISFGDVFVYLVIKKCFYTGEAFKNYKGLEAYNFLTSGKITDILSFTNNTLGICLVTCLVQASQTLAKFHLPWALVQLNGTIISAHCTCMAGLGEACSHVAGLLLAVETGVREGLKSPSCTSQPCKWKKVSKKPDLIPAAKICFSHERIEKDLSKAIPNAPPREAFEQFLNVVKNELPNAPIFSMMPSEEDDELTSSASEGGDTEENIVDIIRTCDSLMPIDATNRVEKIFDHLCSLRLDTDEIEEKTRMQMDDSLWMKQRKGRITASLFHRVIRCKSGHAGIVRDILQISPVETKAMRWGKIMEKKAVASFIKVTEKLHVNFIFRPTGLKVDNEYPFLGASTDGLVQCDCHSPAVVEVKCPYNLKNKKINENMNKNFFLDQDLNLKTNHPYYNQIQGQMGIWNCQRCIFITYTTKDLNIQEIEFDEAYWSIQKPTLIKFYKQYALPMILDL